MVPTRMPGWPCRWRAGGEQDHAGDRWRPTVRAGLVGGVAAWALWVLALFGLASVPWFDHLMHQAGRPELTQLNASTIPYLLAMVVAATLGAVVASRLPGHLVGWLLPALGSR